MSYNYTTYTAALAELMVTDPTNTDFLAIIPSIIDYAEQRIYRELDLLNTVVRDSTGVLSVNNRNFILPTSVGVFVVVQGINVITPAGTAPDNGTRNQLLPTTRDYLDAVWPSVTGAATPTNYAPITQAVVIVGPWPDAAYVVEVIGTQRPNPLSQTNPTTLLSTSLPDVLMAASMVFASGFMRNFGSQADDAKMAVSWESQYQTLKASADQEEFRKKLQATGWTSQQPSPMTPPRT